MTDISEPAEKADRPASVMKRRQSAGDLLTCGTVVPAHPLALNVDRKLNERRQRALSRYYIAAGSGGLAVGVHTTQFEIHDPQCGLLQPVLALAAEEMDRADQDRDQPLVRVAGVCGDTSQAVAEAELARDLGYQLGLVSLRGMQGVSQKNLLNHCREVAEVIDVFGFYLQPKVGGVALPYEFWRGFCEIEEVKAIKVAAFNRYQTIDVVRAVAESGRKDISLYTGNDDNILMDLVTPYVMQVGDQVAQQRFVGGLLGHWAVWTSQAVKLLEQCRQHVASGQGVSEELLSLAIQTTDANAAIFDAANDFHGCVPGINEVLRRQGLLEGSWCLNKNETLSPGQAEEIDRVCSAYPHLRDDSFVSSNLDQWLSG